MTKKSVPYTKQRWVSESGYEGTAYISNSRRSKGELIRVELSDMGQCVLAHDNNRRMKHHGKT